jgi:hypothetical protein
MTERTLRDSRQKYSIAHAVCQTCAKAISDARTSGAVPSQRLLDNELDALRVLGEARRELLAAITAVHCRHLS